MSYSGTGQIPDLSRTVAGPAVDWRSDVKKIATDAVAAVAGVPNAERVLSPRKDMWAALQRRLLEVALRSPQYSKAQLTIVLGGGVPSGSPVTGPAAAAVADVQMRFNRVRALLDQPPIALPGSAPVPKINATTIITSGPLLTPRMPESAIVAAAQMYRNAVAAAKSLMPLWTAGAEALRVADLMLSSARIETPERFRLRVGLWQGITRASMPAARTSAAAVRAADALIAAQTAFRDLVLKPATAPAITSVLTNAVISMTMSAPGTKVSTPSSTPYVADSPEAAVPEQSQDTSTPPATVDQPFPGYDPTAAYVYQGAPVPTDMTVTTGTATVTETTPSAGPLGLSWKVWGAGAVVLAIGGYIIFSEEKKTTPNRRRRRR